MFKFWTYFRSKEEGAVTVDWVVLTTVVAGMSVFSYTTIKSGATQLTTATAEFLASQNP